VGTDYVYFIPGQGFPIWGQVGPGASTRSSCNHGMVWYGMVWCPSYPLGRKRCDQVVRGGSLSGRRLRMLRESPYRPRLFGDAKKSETSSFPQAPAVADQLLIIVTIPYHTIPLSRHWRRRLLVLLLSSVHARLTIDCPSYTAAQPIQVQDCE
jgi:hypothetical protein